jgi:peroxin-13
MDFAHQQQSALVGGVISQQEQTFDPSKLTFAHALYPFETSSHQEINLKKGDIVAILSMADPVTGSTDTAWWRGRTRDGREGWFPKDYVEVIKKKVVDSSTTMTKVEEKTKKLES